MTPERLAAAHEPGDGRHELVGLVELIVALGAHDAVPCVLVEQAEGDLVERRLDRVDLRQDVNALPVVFDHRLNAAGLALDAPKPLEQVVLGRAVPALGRGGGGLCGWGDGGRHGVSLGREKKL